MSSQVDGWDAILQFNCCNVTELWVLSPEPGLGAVSLLRFVALPLPPALQISCFQASESTDTQSRVDA